MQSNNTREMMWLKRSIILAIYLIIHLNMSGVTATTGGEMEFGRQLISNDQRTRSIELQVMSDRINDQYYRDNNLEWRSSNNIFNERRSAMYGDNDGSEESSYDTHVSELSKRSGVSRLCGSRLVEAIIKLCNGCVKPVGGKAVTLKRCKLNCKFHLFFFANFRKL